MATPSVQAIRILTTTVGTYDTPPSVQAIRILSIPFTGSADPRPQIQAFQVDVTELTNQNITYPKIQALQIDYIGPTYWLNGQSVGDLFTLGITPPQNESIYTWIID